MTQDIPEQAVVNKLVTHQIHININPEYDPDKGWVFHPNKIGLSCNYWLAHEGEVAMDLFRDFQAGSLPPTVLAALGTLYTELEKHVAQEFMTEDDT